MVKMIVAAPANKTPSKTTSTKKSEQTNRLIFTGIFIAFETKYDDFRNSFVGFILKDIREMPSKSLVSDWQWFNMTQKFKMAFESYKDEELPGKQIQFAGIKETHKKGYYTYQGSVLISGPEDLEHRILRPNDVKILEG
jgi:hypothetical protein